MLLPPHQHHTSFHFDLLHTLKIAFWPCGTISLFLSLCLQITLTRQFGLARSQQRSQYHHQHNYSALMRLGHGSMRLQPASCSVNNNALEPYGSYRVVQFRCRDGSHQLSQQDSIRTNTTTTTINSTSQVGVTAVSGGGGGRGRSRKPQELYGGLGPGVVAGTHRMLQAQVSHAVLDGAKRHTLLATNNGALLLSPAAESVTGDAVDSSQVQQPATRLKLSRVISRRDEGVATYSGSCSLPEQELCHSSDATTAAVAEVRRMPWRKKRQKRNAAINNETGAAGRHATPKSL